MQASIGHKADFIEKPAPAGLPTGEPLQSLAAEAFLSPV